MSWPVRLRIEDDGRGFDGEPGGGFGLTGVRERVGHLGGTVDVTSRPDHGVTLTVELPG